MEKRGFNNKKAQAAMEFLTTYGWAILILIIVVAALVGLGVFKSPGTPPVCTATAPIICSGVKVVEAGTITFDLGAVGVSAASVTAITVSSPSGVTTCVLSDPAAIVTSGTETKDYTGCGTLTKGNRVIGSVDATYTLENSNIDHTTTINFNAAVE